MPVIGCDCRVCTSADPRDQRLRSSALISAGQLTVLIDAGPDFRQQMLRTGVRNLDAILLTHEHNDHVIGLDDVRPFNFRSGRAIEVYALPRVADEVRKRFEYVFGHPIPGLPRIELIPIGAEDALELEGMRIQPIDIMHGRLPILGYRIGELAYLTDVKSVAPAERDKLRGVRYLVVSALHHERHPTHFNLEEALAFVNDIRPEKAWLTHLSHDMGLAAEIEPLLPEGVALGYDGLEIEF